MAARIGLLGGTFDPIHVGHVRGALHVRDALLLDKIVFIPNRISPFKRNQPITSADHRAAMVRLAIADQPALETSEFEMQRPAPSYTLDTVTAFRQELGPDVELFWIIGADSLAELAGWHRIGDLVRLCQIVTMARPEFETPDLSELAATLDPDQIRGLRDHCLSTPMTDVSSTQIRHRVRVGDSIAALVSPPVAEYIHQHGLYRK